MPHPGKIGIAEKLNEMLRTPQVDSLSQETRYWVGRAVEEAFAEFKKPQPWKIRPSGQKCTRAEALAKLGKITDRRPEAEGVFFAGKVAEIFTIGCLEIAGVPVRDKQRTVLIPGPVPVEGHIDGIVDFEGKSYLIDVKSTTAIGFKNIETELLTGGDPWGYKRQLRTYMLALKAVEGAVLLYMTKEYWHTWAEVFVPRPDEGHQREWDGHVRALMAVTEDPATLPGRPYWAELKERPRAKDKEITALQCRYCQSVRACWADVGEFTHMGQGVYRTFPVS